MSAFQQAFRLFPVLLAGSLTFVADEAQAAPRGSNAWCEQMMDKPSGMWSVNDHKAFDGGCKAQHMRLAQRQADSDRRASLSGDQVVHDEEARTEAEIRRDTNRIRAKHGLPPLPETAPANR